jgi:hypothetical protein
MGMPAQPHETQGRRASSMPVERPLIAVSTSEIRRSQAVAPTPQGEPPQHEMALGLKYLRAIEAAGGLTATGWASDGTVESLEAADGGFLLGVQWHAECLMDRACQAALFRDFVGAARAFDQTLARLAFAA